MSTQERQRAERQHVDTSCYDDVHGKLRVKYQVFSWMLNTSDVVSQACGKDGFSPDKYPYASNYT